jgi:hypothetical protein
MERSSGLLSLRQLLLSHHSLAILLPPLGLLDYLGIRQLLGLPPIVQMYEKFWLQTTAVPGAEQLSPVHKMLAG